MLIQVRRQWQATLMKAYHQSSYPSNQVLVWAKLVKPRGLKSDSSQLDLSRVEEALMKALKVVNQLHLPQVVSLKKVLQALRVVLAEKNTVQSLSNLVSRSKRRF